MSSSELDLQTVDAGFVEPADPLLRLQAASSAPAFYRFVLTGGPCAGKTTALARLSAHFSENGFSVYTVPEAATLLFTNGAALQDFAVDGMPLAFQWSLLKMQIALEEGFERIARAKGKPAVLLCDRGLMDGSAYMDPSQWAQMLAGMQLDTMACREGRYDAVFHLVTAAIGAEAHYSLENNVARSETVAEAAETDRKLQAAWLGHPHHHIIGNVPGEGFNDKIERVVSAASQQLGLPTKRREHKYLLKEVIVSSTSSSLSNSSSSSTEQQQQQQQQQHCLACCTDARVSAQRTQTPVLIVLLLAFALTLALRCRTWLRCQCHAKKCS
jgi:predicted ATPase